ncbi:FUSC family protein [Lacisediminihabitans profunda]|uniref:FUSC family protein n=1 Tax=Lacisediminihabitans profunda TaxID=2594790 RepID=A0A5C8UW82_9MICO|nr:FUSC family protein [Lacisediminihabitans profunda]TXN32825.1 FUSC family protein [Lacisediminihabitans profunda]
MRLIASLRASSRSPILQVLKTSVAAIVAWLLCVLLLGQPLPIFAAIAALLVVQPSVNQSLAKGIERSVGVVFGVLLAYGAGALFGHSSWIVLGIIVVSLLLAWALRLSPGSANQIPISAMLVLAIGVQTPGYAVNRIIETVIGAVVGLAVNAAIVPPVLLTPAHDAVQSLAAKVAASLRALARSLREPQDDAQLAAILEDARALRTLKDSAADALDRAEESLMLNPRRGRHRSLLERDRDLLAILGPLVTRVIGMARALHDRYDPELVHDRVAVSIGVELDRAAHDLELLARPLRSLPPLTAPITAELPALTAPLVVASPDSQHWILVGSLLEDLRRVREEIIGAEE